MPYQIISDEPELEAAIIDDEQYALLSPGEKKRYKPMYLDGADQPLPASLRMQILKKLPTGDKDDPFSEKVDLAEARDNDPIDGEDCSDPDLVELFSLIRDSRRDR